MRKVFCLILVLAMALVFMPVNTHAASGTRTLSGTLTFSSPVKANTEIYVYVGYAYGPFWYGDQYSKTIEVKAGATKADFSLSVAPEVYILEFDGPQEWFYYGVEDKLTDDYSQRMYFDLMEKSVTGLSVKGDALLAGTSSSTDVNVNVTVNLPEKLSESKQLCIIAGTEEDSWITSSWPTVKAGESKAAVTFSLPANEKYYFYYADATGSDWVGDDRTGFLYGAESGVSSLRSKAKLYDISKSTSVTLSYPTYYTVSGKLDRTGYVDGSPAVAYVIAEFADGEKYTDRVVYAENEKTKSFKIYVPRSQKGNSYTLYTAPAENVNDVGVITSMQKKFDAATLSGNRNAGTLTMGSLSFIKYSGTIGLPSGLKAPAGGVTVQLSSYQDDIYLDFGNVTIPEGASSASFSFLSKAEVSKLTASLTAPVAGAFYEVTATVSGHSGINVTFPEEAVISGTVYFPEGTDAAYVGEIRAEMDQAYCYTSFAMRHGETPQSIICM